MRMPKCAKSESREKIQSHKIEKAFTKRVSLALHYCRMLAGLLVIVIVVVVVWFASYLLTGLKGKR